MHKNTIKHSAVIRIIVSTSIDNNIFLYISLFTIIFFYYLLSKYESIMYACNSISLIVTFADSLHVQQAELKRKYAG